MPTYTIQQDPSRMPVRASVAPSSVYSEDYDSTMPDQDMPPVPPLKGQQGSHHPSYHAHSRQQINDYGPQVRQSRLPIFKQVRSMLHKPPTLATPGNPKWDEYTGELSINGKSSQVQPSKYTSPYDGAFEARRRSPEKPNTLKKNASPARSNKSNRSRRNASPVSVLRDHEAQQSHDQMSLPRQHDDTEWSPVSPVSPISPIPDTSPELDQDMMPSPLSPNVIRAPHPHPLPQPPLPRTPPSNKQIKRKPAPRSTSTAENHPPPPPSPQHSPTFSIDMQVRVIDDKDPNAESSPQPEPSSHFSWTTYAPSLAPGRQSTDTTPSKFPKRHSSLLPAAHEEQPNSRFSWSTVATNTTTTPHLRPESPPPSPPPPIPEKYSTPIPQMQSIVSRRRPIPRSEKEEWAPPPPRKNSAASTTPQNTTPISAHTVRPLPILPRSGNRSGSSTPTSTHTTATAAGKALPPPPPSLSSNLTHIQLLEAQSQNLIHQRRNVQRGISELEKIEHASPMDVPFAIVRDTKRRLEEHRRRLEEILLEERDVGVRITRARRKEEREEGWEGEGIWVRRVTG